ncbi:outer membrane beta-barrel protein [Haliea sp. E17]|uniref:outer membrane beta-barrel protein n=1 Tax=Haliea sp. E17 TaxID=3401576 RepID=UPI003AAD2B96
MKTIKFLWLPALLACLPLYSAHAADSRRAERWETTFALIASDSEDISGNRQSEVAIDNSVGFGFGAAYNLDAHVALGFEFSYLNPDYQAVYNTEQKGLVSVEHEMDIFNGNLNATWNVLEGPFTPYLRANLGWTYIDSNIANGPPVTGCWWDPWWGYICSNVYDSYDDNSFSWGFGAGLRYEFNNDWFIRASVNRSVIDASHGFDPVLDSFNLELGWMLWDGF